MPRVSPFAGLVFDPAVVGPLDRVTAPPYDVIGDAAEQEYVDASPYNVVRLDLAEREGSDRGYAHAGKLLSSWRRERALILLPEAYYAYEMRFEINGAHRQICGLLCAVELEEWGDGVIPHERTMPGPVSDRLRLMRATASNISPVYGAMAGPCPALGELLEAVMAEPPPWAAADDERVEHRMWSVAPEAVAAEWFAEESLLIADGHHRYQTALQYREERRAAEGPGPWDHVMALVVDAGTQEMPVLPYHRVVRQVTGAVVVSGDRVRDLAEMLAALDDESPVVGFASLADGALAHQVVRLGGEPPAVRALHERVLGPDIVGDEDLWFTPDALLAEDAVRRRDAAAAFFLPPTTTQRIRSVIAQGQRLPQKSTFFWPKPRTGMVIRPLE